MKHFLTKILFLFLFTIFFISCNAVKRVSEDNYLLDEATIYIDSTKTNDPRLYGLLSQKRNTRLPLLGTPLRLHVYNLAQKNTDSSYNQWLKNNPKKEKRMNRFFSRKQVDRLGVSLNRINEWLKEIGEPPVLVDEEKTKKSVKQLKYYYWNHGWLNAEANYKINYGKNQKAKISYYVKPHTPYFLDSLTQNIASIAADSIYKTKTQESHLKSGNQFNTQDVENERERITSLFRNSGLYNFEKEYIGFTADTNNTKHKVHLLLSIKDRKSSNDYITEYLPFKVHKISKVNIFTDYSYQYRNQKPKDSTSYNGYTIYSYDKLRYTRKALTNSILITPGDVFKDRDRTLTYNQINNLRAFKYPTIRYEIDPNNPEGTDLISNIFLTPKKKYSTNIEFDVSTSNIQAFGIGFGGSFLIRNLFRGAEILEISGRGSVGSSNDPVSPDDEFFDISEVGLDFKLSFPKLLFPINTQKIIPKYMSPTTNMIFGINTQQNIGLDKQNASGIFNYLWRPNTTTTNQFDIINIQYVRNLNTSNYFRIYSNSYNRLNTIAQNVLAPSSPFFNSTENNNLTIPGGANGFILQSISNNPNSGLTTNQINEIRNINERKQRLTEDNLILASAYSYLKNTRQSIYDENFFNFRTKLELAGNVLNTISDIAELRKNSNDRYEIFGVEFSQYVKTELDFIKHWDLDNKNILAFRFAGGVALPYGNANSIPFARSFFAGGPNDNRAWLPYDLGPGSSGGQDEFNEANMKIALNLEYRYNILGALNGAFFIDTGNIWNVLDNVEDEKSVFNSIKDLQEIAVGTGLGLRYDFDFFIIRLDLGFKTFNPANDEDQRWFKGYNFSKGVYNIGINYPF